MHHKPKSKTKQNSLSEKDIIKTQSYIYLVLSIISPSLVRMYLSVIRHKQLGGVGYWVYCVITINTITPVYSGKTISLIMKT